MAEKYIARYELDIEGKPGTIEMIYTPRAGELPLDIAEDFRETLEKTNSSSRVKMTHFDLVGRVKSA